MPKTKIKQQQQNQPQTKYRKKKETGLQWLTPVILAIQEAEIRRI
jgi:hypothetical protein